jgi:hypothetical protein
MYEQLPQQTIAHIARQSYFFNPQILTIAMRFKILHCIYIMTQTWLPVGIRTHDSRVDKWKWNLFDKRQKIYFATIFDDTAINKTGQKIWREKRKTMNETMQQQHSIKNDF